jgi:tetratricopeptide (TPR) repeat protein
MDKNKTAPAKAPAATAPPTKTPDPAPVTVTPPLFRRIDWLAFALTTLAVWLGYFYTLAPDLTLEDSGELAVASLYAGIPHPPGYPVWTIYTWLWANFLPFNNIAWRVALGEATAGAFACGLLGLLVSRGSSMMMESIAELKKIGTRWESAICIVSGFVAGTLLGFNGYMWSQSVIVEVYSFSVLSLVAVLLFLLRWVYAPHQYRYLYLAFFMYGICVNNHQSLLPIAMGFEVLILAVQPRLAREFLFWNVVIYLLMLAAGPSLLIGNKMVFIFFNIVGILSTGGWTWLSVRAQRETSGYVGGAAVALAVLLFLLTKDAKSLPVLGLLVLLGLRVAAAYDALVLTKARISKYWLATIISGLAFGAGMAFYLYMALAGMSNPPMQWGYPRTLEGFIHAFTRGQYEKISPTSGGTGPFFEQVGNFIGTYTKQFLMYLDGLDNEFNLVCVLIAVGTFLFYRQMQKRERGWLIGLVGIFICLGPLLVFLLNPPPDRQARELIRVFFTASHVLVSAAVGYGMALLAASLATHYQAFRRVALMGALVAVDLALVALAVETYSLLGTASAASQDVFLDGLVKFAFVTLTATSLALVGFRLLRSPDAPSSEFKSILTLSGIGLACLLVSVVLFRNPETGVDAPAMIGFAKLVCVLIAAICLFFSSHQNARGDRLVLQAAAGLVMLLSLVMTAAILMGNRLGMGGIGEFIAALFTAFRPGQFALPVLANLMLLGLTVIFLAGVLIYRNRAPLALTLLIFAVVPLQSYMSHWADNEQRGHLFGYWFGHDMFTPPFNGKDGKPLYPEMTRDAILYGGTDPGRFCPTYTIFCESFTPPECKPRDPKFDRRDVYIITQNALADGTYLNYIRAHYHRSAQKARRLDTPFFQEAIRAITKDDREKNWSTNWFGRAALPLDRLFTGVGESIEKNRRAGSSFFKPQDFTDLKSFAEKLRQPANGITKQLVGELSAETKTLLAGGNESALRKALAEDLNRVIEKGLYDDKAMATNVELRWRATFELEAITDEKQRVAPLGPSAIQRLVAQEALAKQKLDRIQAELVRQAGEVKTRLSEAGVPLTPHLAAFILETPQSFTRIRLNRQLLEAAFPKEIAVSPGGVYPDREMYIASPQDSQQCFQEYLADAQERLKKNQLKPGEDVRIIDNRVQVSGQVAVMAINGLLTKVMFDKNPDNEFFVEESFPLDWMYPHLTPFGVIMKINRQPLKTLPETVMETDHEFWSQFSDRLIGNWITYDTSVSNIVDFVQKVYLRHNWSGLNEGQRMFARDDQGQKAFSKLRSSIGGVYAWRLGPYCPPEYRPRNEAETRRLYKEADFTFKQAFAFCPYSPEAVFRYINLLIQPPPPITPRIDDALMIAETAQKLDPYNGQIAGLIANLKDYKSRMGQFSNAQKLEDDYRANPNNYAAGLALASYYFQAQQTERAYAVLDGIVANPKVDVTSVMTVLQAYRQLENYPKLETAMTRLVQLQPDSPEAWYDLGSLRATLGKTVESLSAISNAVTISTARRATNPAALDLVAEARKDGRLNPLRALPEFQKLVPAQSPPVAANWRSPQTSRGGFYRQRRGRPVLVETTSVPTLFGPAVTNRFFPFRSVSPFVVANVCSLYSSVGAPSL